MQSDDSARVRRHATRALHGPTVAEVHDDHGGSSVRIRRIEQRDAATYIDLLHRIDGETELLAWEPGERILDIEALRTRTGEAEPATGLHLLATHRDQIVGFLVSHRPAMRRLRHRADFTMAVLQEFHRLGIGWQLLDALHTWAAAQNIEQVELTVMSHNRSAIALYRRAGYEREGIKRGSIRIDGQPVDEVLMAKWLDPASGGPS